MKYDSESGKILITLGEFVSIARRRIAASLPYDDEEPSLGEVSARRLRAVVRDIAEQKINFGFSAAGRDFELTATVSSTSENSIVIAREIESSPKKPSRQELAQIRGEGYIAAYALTAVQGCDEAEIRFLYFNPLWDEHGDSVEKISRGKLRSFFDKCVKEIVIYATPEIERVTVRLPSMRTMKFPYKNVRDGQSEFVRSAYRTLCRGGFLYASAPTGTGKTVSALYPALRALGDGRRDKVFYLTPKATTSEAARECLERMAEQGVSVKAVILTAKEKCCAMEHICRRSRRLCPMSGCNKLAEAALELYNSGLTVVRVDDIAPIAKKWQVCPYELSLSYAELCDVVICDFNYLFDPSVYIRRFFTAGGNYAILVDEAHNLHERAREMYSAEICAQELSAPSRAEVLGPLSMVKKASAEAEKIFCDIFYPYVKEDIRERGDGTMAGAVNLSEIPAKMYTLVDNLLKLTESELYANYSAEDEEKDARVSLLRSYYYDLKKFHDVMARFDDCYKLFVFFTDGSIKVKLFCLDTGPIVRERLEKGAAGVLFSATLSPLNYYRSVLGGDRSDDTLEVSSPFDNSQLSVSIMDKISTRFSEREDTLGAVCRVIAATISAKRGNYIVFSPSFAYSDALARAFAAKHPKLHIISQKKNMSAKEKAEFIGNFRDESDKSYLVAFCVMGGIYSEGIDLAGDSLIGAVIVGIGMPSLSYEREAIAEYYQEKYEEGKQYAYIYPGMNRVFQAAGRVIRTEEDKGVIVLIDDRFADPIYKKSVPKLWGGLRFIDDAKRLKEVLDEFWEEKH